jgi:hypothetical protein
MSLQPSTSNDVLYGAGPLAVSVKNASRLPGIGTTSMWQLIRDGRVETIGIGRRRLVIYESLKRLVTARAA